MKNHRLFLSLLLLLTAISFSACSLSKDLFKMEDSEDYEAYVDKWAPTEEAFVAVQRLAKPAIDAKDWEGAVAVFEKYKSRFPGMETRFDQIVAVLRAPSYDVELKNLGDNINTPFDEIKPSVTVDGKRMYFASDKEGGKGKLDIYVSDFKDGAWQPAVNLGDRINTPDHETINGISFDGTKILIYGGFPGHMGNGDNYYFEKTDRGWSNIMHFPPMVNSKFYDSDAFMTADGYAVLFTSDRDGVVGDRVPKNTRYHGSIAGNTDIFVSVRRGTYWQPPVNLGKVINTPFAERSPFLHPDGKTLYFASDGHPGLGKMDVFKSVRSNTNSWTEWSEPINLGKDINGSDDDWGYRITPDGKYAFFSTSNQPDGRGENDIYMVTLPRGVRPEAEVATLEGKVLDDDDNPIPGVVVQVQDLETGDVVATLQPDPETGEYMGTVPEGKKYGVFAEKEGYYPDAKAFDLADASLGGNGDGSNGDGNGGNRNGNGDGNGGNRNGNGDGTGGNRNGNGDGTGGNRNGNGDGTGGNRNGNGDGTGGNRNGNGDGNGDDDGMREFTHDFRLKSVDAMTSKRDKWGDLLAQRVNTIFFDFNKWDLKPESFFELDRLTRFLRTNPSISIVIAAHTDDVGTDEYNLDLSRKRALSVVNHLVQNGINQIRLESIGYGESRPEVPNDSDEHRAQNRRVEFRIAE